MQYYDHCITRLSVYEFAIYQHIFTFLLCYSNISSWRTYMGWDFRSWLSITGQNIEYILCSQPQSCNSWRCLCYFHETHLNRLIFCWIRHIAIRNIHYIPQVIVISRSRCWNPSILIAGDRMFMIEEGANTSPRATTQGLKFSSAEYSAEGFLKILELVTDIQTSV